MAFFTNSAIHMYAHGSWAEVLMLAGGAELGLVHGRLHVAALAADVAARVRRHRDRVHRARAEPVVLRAVGVPAPPARLDVPRRRACAARARVPAALGRAPGGFAVVIVVVSIQLFTDRDVAPVFGHLSPLAGPAHR